MPRVKFYATLRSAAGERETEVEGRNVRELLDNVSRKYEGKLDRYMKISTVLVNGKNVIHLKGGRTRLRKEDVVSIFPPLGGG